MDRDWLAHEPRWGALPAQARALFFRGVRRPLALLVGSLVLVAGLGFGAWISERGYAPRLLLRVVEGTRDPGVPGLKRKLAEYVRSGVFTREPLFELIRRHRLYPKLAATDKSAALEAFRRDIHVEVYQNYFVEQRAEGGQPRSARVAVSYRARDRATAVAVTRDLGALVVQRETLRRREQAERAAAAADLSEESLKTALAERVESAARKQAELAASPKPDPALQVELVSLLGSLAVAERQVDAADKRAAALELGARFEQSGMGLSFEVADEPGVGISTRSVAKRVLVCAVLYVCALPLLVMTVGALSPKGRTP
jgi:hypothetical protein